MNKILSIIIPTYNMEKYLNKCLDSLIVDNIDLLEILVINDGSKDNSSEIAHTYENKYPFTFKVIDKENGNYGSCINRGLKEATGKYIKVLDADDYFEKENFSSYLSFLKNSNADLIITDFQIINESDQPSQTITFDITPHKNISFDDIYLNKSFKNIQMHAITYNKEVFTNLNYKQTEGISYTDQEWVFSPMTRVHNILYYNKIIYKYLLGREGQTMDPAISLKLVSHTVQGIYNTISTYNKIFSKLSNSSKSFLQYRLVSRINNLYLTHLIEDNIKLKDPIISFDNQLKHLSMELYNLTEEECQFYKIKYVRLWRKYPRKIFIIVKFLLKCRFNLSLLKRNMTKFFTRNS